MGPVRAFSLAQSQHVRRSCRWIETFLDSDWFASGILAWVHFCLTFGTAIWKPCGSRNCGRACSLSKWQFWETILSQSVVASELRVTEFFTEISLIPQNRRYSVKNPVTASSEAKWGHPQTCIWLKVRLAWSYLWSGSRCPRNFRWIYSHSHGACLFEIQTYDKKRGWTTPARLIKYIQHVFSTTNPVNHDLRWLRTC